MSTKTVASAPSAITIRLSGHGRGRLDTRPGGTPTSARTASPMKKTSLPSDPVCQPITLIVRPSPGADVPAHQGRHQQDSPESHVRRSPTAQSRTGLRGPPASRGQAHLFAWVKYGHRGREKSRRTSREGVAMSELRPSAAEPGGDFVDFRPAGAQRQRRVPLRRVRVRRDRLPALPVCPMCGGEAVGAGAWSPLSRARSARQSGQR